MLSVSFWNVNMLSTLLPHQVAGRDWCLEREEAGCILADDMGLGKTVTTCAVMVAKPVKTLIVAPLALLEQWKEEIAKHTTGLTAAIYRGGSGANARLPNTMVIITNPETVVGDSKKGRLEAYDVFQRIVVDEAHVLRNPKSKLFKAIADASESIGRKLLLTGTPVCNKSTDLITLVTLLNIPLYSNGEYWRGMGIKREVESLKFVRANFVLRRTKEEVIADRLPKKEIRNVEIRLEDSELYNKEYNRLRARQFRPVIAKIMRLRQCVNQISLVHTAMSSDPSIVREYGEDPARLPAELSAKLKYIHETVGEVLADAPDQKIVVFSQWTMMLGHIAAAIGDLTTPLTYHGQLESTEKNAVLQKFREDSDARVLLISLKSGGCGLNLCVANHVIITEPYFNGAEEKQAIDRVYRIGQTRDVVVHKLYVPNTVESWMHQLQNMKNTITNSVLNTETETAKDAETIVAEKATKKQMFQTLVQGA